jgi:hypothetical protein
MEVFDVKSVAIDNGFLLPTAEAPAIYAQLQTHGITLDDVRISLWYVRERLWSTPKIKRLAGTRQAKPSSGNMRPL